MNWGPSSRLISPWRSYVCVTLAVGVVLVLVVVASGAGSEPVFCQADGRLEADGSISSRDPALNCQFPQRTVHSTGETDS